MNVELAVVLLATGIGAVGYAAGTVVAHPGRSFSIPALMAGMALAIVGRRRPTDPS